MFLTMCLLVYVKAQDLDGKHEENKSQTKTVGGWNTIIGSEKSKKHTAIGRKWVWHDLVGEDSQSDYSSKIPH